MTFLIKALLGTAVAVVPASIGAVVAYRGSIFSDSQKEEVSIEYLKERCYVIPTETSDTAKQAKLLVCDSRSYFLYNHEGKGKINYSEQIKKSGENLEISWEAWGDSSNEGGTSRQNASLKISEVSKWQNIKEGVNIKDTCQLVTSTKGSESTEWQCKGSSLISDTEEVKIQLTKFSD